MRFVLVLLISLVSSACALEDELSGPPPDEGIQFLEATRRNLGQIDQILEDLQPRDWGTSSSVVLITLDTTRADRLGAYGYPEATTPTLDRFAETAVLFEYALSPNGSTTPSHASILTGLYPYHHGVRDNGRFRLLPEQTTLAERLARAGYSTAAFTSAYTASRRFGLDQGFEVYRDPRSRSKRRRSFRGIKLEEGQRWDRFGDETLLEALQWIERASHSNPVFLWLHLFDPHEPYLPPIVDAIKDYDSEIRFVDLLLDRFLRGLRASGLWDSAVIIVVGDHGQALGEHDRCCHTGSVFDSVLRVPLLLRLPGEEKGRRVDRLVRTIDIVPTVLEILEIDPESILDGASLEVFYRDQRQSSATRERSLFADSQVYSAERPPQEVRQKYAIRSQNFKIVRTYVDQELIEEQVYDLRIDPGETDPAADIPAGVRAALVQELDERIAQARKIDARAVISVNEEDRKKLEALGYLQ